MKSVVLILSLLGLGYILSPLQAEDAQPAKRAMPSPATAEHNLNLALYLQNYQLDGIVRGKSHAYQVTLVTSGWNMTYIFPSEHLKYVVCMGPDSKSVQQVSPEQSAHILTAEELKQHILDTDITFEDLSLAFTLWPCKGDIAEDSIKTLPAWCFTVARPDAPSNYGKVKLWVSSEFHGLLRLDAYDAHGDVIKRMEINDVSKTNDGSYTLKELMINTMIPGRDISASQTFIDIDSSKKLP